MKIVFETKRLILRELNLSDSQQFFKLNSDSEVLKYTGDQPFSSTSDALKFLKNYTDYEVNGFGRWAVISKESNLFLGWSGLKLNEESMIDLGYRFFRKEWGKGYATEAAKGSIEYGFDKLNIKTIIGRTSIENKASVHILKKLGMNFWKNDNCKGIQNSSYYKIDKVQYDKRKKNQL